MACGYREQLCSDFIFAGDASEDSSSPDPGRLQVDDLRDRVVGVVVGDVLGDPLVGSGGVVVQRVLGQDSA